MDRQPTVEEGPKLMPDVNPYLWALMISLIPVLIVLGIYLFRNVNNKRGIPFLLGFLAITVFYIVAPDPMHLATFYIAQGDYVTPLISAGVSGVLLVIAVIFFKKHRQ